MKVDAAFLMSDGAVVQKQVEWWPLDMSPEAVAERTKIHQEYLRRKALEK